MLSRRNFLQMLLAGGITVAIDGLSGVKALASTGDTTQLTILGTSDVHGRFMPWDYATDTEDRSGSLVQLYTAIKKIRQETPNVILVDCGDSIQDNSVEQFNTQPHQPMIVAMNEMNYDTWTMGNHEFNFGLDVLKHVTDQFKGKKLCGNVYHENGQRYLPAYAIIEKAGIKIGIIGLNTPMITEFEKDTDHLKGVTVTNPTTETRKVIEELKGKADILIGVMHMGLENENNRPDTSVTDIANANPELTAIVAGHMHKNVSSATVNGVLISEPYKYGQALTRIDLTLSRKDNRWEVIDKKAQTIPMKNYDSDGRLVEILAPFHLAARKTANEEIGKIAGMNMVPEDSIPGISEVQITDTPLTHFFNEVQLYYSGADVTSVIISRDNAQMAVGPVRRKDIAFNYQYTGGETTVYEITGKDLRTYMEWSAAYFNQKQPGDIAPSYNPARRASKYSTNDIFGGVNYVIDLNEPVGSRIKNLRLSRTGKTIKDTDKIKLGMNAYRMNQLTAKGGIFEGQHFKQLWTSIEAFGENEGTIRNMSIRYIKDVKKGVLNVKPVNNWHIEGFDRKSETYQKAAKLLREKKITLHNSADGKYTNIASLNEKDIAAL